LTEDWRNGGFGLYIHWPFCESKCPYCDFNSHVASKIEWKRWKRAYLSEIDRVATLSSDRTLESVYFGGGTPGLMRRSRPGPASASVIAEACCTACHRKT